jgi:RimJ/RimL family protein N-acetyltransferase
VEDGAVEPAPVVPGDRVVLTRWTDADVPAVLELAADPVTRRGAPSLRRVGTKDDARAWLAGRSSPTRVDWAVRDAETGRFLGRVGLHHVDPSLGQADIGYGTTPSARGQGVATRAVEAACRHGFEALGLRRITLRHAVGNTASCHVAMACGFVLEGVERAVLDDGEGGFDDVHLHARLADDPPGPLVTPAPRHPVELAAGPYRLRAWAESDAPAVLAAAADPEIARWNPFASTTPDLAAALAWCAGRADWDGSHASWAVCAASGELLGSVSLHQLDPHNAGGEVGYWTAPPARGRGVAAAAVRTAARFAFEVLGLQRVELFHAVDNPASCRVATKAGFALEGTHRSSFRYGDGRLHDEHSHARLAADADANADQKD